MNSIIERAPPLRPTRRVLESKGKKKKKKKKKKTRYQYGYRDCEDYPLSYFRSDAPLRWFANCKKTFIAQI